LHLKMLTFRVKGSSEEASTEHLEDSIEYMI
jgi:hypothetical protein